MKYFKISSLIFLSLLNVGISTAQKAAGTAGTSSSLLLRFESSARVAGMGGAFTGLVDDENALYYNPAGLAYLNQGIFSLNHTQWFEDIKIENMLATYNLSRKFGAGAGFTHMWMPEIQGRDASGQLTRPFDVSSSIITAALAYQITYGFNAGFAVKYFMDNLANYKASGFGFDFGLHLKTALKGLQTGLLVQNLGSEITYDKEKQKLPLTIRLGLVYKLFEPDFNFVADAVKSSDSDPAVHLGFEYIHMDQFFVRLGNQFSWNVLFTPSLGIGFMLRDQFVFNYAFVVHPELGATHRLGFSFRFNSPPKSTGPGYYAPATTNASVYPPVPVNVKVRSSKTELAISWGAVSGAEYNVYSRHASQSEWHKLNNIPLKKTEMAFKLPKVAGRYCFRINAVINNQESAPSKEVSIDVK